MEPEDKQIHTQEPEGSLAKSMENLIKSTELFTQSLLSCVDALQKLNIDIQGQGYNIDDIEARVEGEEGLSTPVKDDSRFPILYRVVHSDSPPESNGSLVSRLSVPPGQMFKDVSKEMGREYIEDHSDYDNKSPTPFISMTNDPLRALSLALGINHDKTDVSIIMIRSSMMSRGTYGSCNEWRIQCGLDSKPIYNTEFLAWGMVPAKSIRCRVARSHIIESGLLKFMPSAPRLGARLRTLDLRLDLKSNLIVFCQSIPEIAASLSSLPGMDSSNLEVVELFKFLLGRAVGYKMEKEDINIKGFEREYHMEIKEFYQEIQTLTLTTQMELLHLPSSTTSDIKRKTVVRETLLT